MLVFMGVGFGIVPERGNGGPCYYFIVGALEGERAASHLIPYSFNSILKDFSIGTKEK